MRKYLQRLITSALLLSFGCSATWAQESLPQTLNQQHLEQIHARLLELRSARQEIANLHRERDRDAEQDLREAAAAATLLEAERKNTQAEARLKTAAERERDNAREQLELYRASFQALTKKPGSKVKTAAKWGIPLAAAAGVAYILLGR